MVSQKIKINRKTEVDIDDILFFQSSSNYTIIFTLDNYFVSTKNLKLLEKEIDRNNFIRINRGLLVNLFYVKTINLDKTNPHVKLYNTKILNISRRKYESILKDSLDKNWANVSYQF